MRIAASFALLAGCGILLGGCDVLFQLQDVKPQAIDAPAIDAALPDTPPIPPMHCTLPAAWDPSMIGAGTFYTVDASLTSAVFEDNGRIYYTPAGTTQKTVELFASISGLRAPRLAPSGNELLLAWNQPVCCSIVSSTRDGAGTWSTPAPITVQNIVIDSYEVPGVPSAGNGAKRRMVVTNATNDEFFELREDEAGWTLVFNYRAITLGMTAITDANLSPDGYRMYFGGVRMGQTSQRVFMIDRTDLTKAFDRANVIQVRDTAQSVQNVRTPYVSDDCASLWYSLGSSTTATVYKAVPQ